MHSRHRRAVLSYLGPLSLLELRHDVLRVDNLCSRVTEPTIEHLHANLASSLYVCNVPDEKPMGQVIQIDEARIRDHLGEMVRGTVEETLNAMLEAEADQLCGAGRYERSQARQDTRAGSYEQTLQTSAGARYRSCGARPLRLRSSNATGRRESSIEEALIEMYLAGISVRRVEDITEALWGTRVSPSTVSNLNKKIYAKIEAWRNRRIEGERPYLYLDGIVMKRTWAGEVRNVSLLVASAVNSEGFRRQGGQVRLVGVSAALGRPWPQGRATDHF
jgi:Transposase, Mutator family